MNSAPSRPACRHRGCCSSRALSRTPPVGSSPGDAVVLISRRALDRLDRDETQGLLAHLIGSIGNGDLKIALRLVTVFRTFGLVSTLLEVPVSSSARAALWRLLKLLVWPSRPRRECLQLS